MLESYTKELLDPKNKKEVWCAIFKVVAIGTSC